MAVRLVGRSPSGYGSLADVDSSTVKVDVETSLTAGADTDRKEGGATGSRACVSFRYLTYTVGESTWHCRTRPKTILRSASGLLLPGVNAIMGPTGSGKTTLLDILAGRKDKSGLCGVVLVNGELQPKNFKCLSGYVTQDDVVMGTLTVRENLHFSAALRLPSHMTRQQRRERVEKVIGELGLTGCVDTKIGTEFIRGVSGGERKRTSIGMELIIEPQVLFLDEPTTGLDARTAVSVIQLLKQLSTYNDRIIVLSIHQPRYSIFKLFDTLTLLSRGDTVYHGPSNMALDYFERHGYVCEEHENPADYFLDVVSICEGQDSAFDAGYDSVASNPQTLKRQEVTDLATTYQSSEEYSKVMEKVDPMVDRLRDRETALKRSSGTRGTYARNPLWQFFVVTRRSALNIMRNPMTSIFQVIHSTVLALVIGTVYIQSSKLTKDNLENVFENKLGAIFLLVMGQVFSNLSAIELFIKQRALFIHENAGGYYRVSTYFLSKVATDIIPLRIIPVCIYSLIVYFMVGLQVDATKFFIFLLGLSLTSLTGSSIVFAVSAALKVSEAANLLAILIYVLSMLFAGFLVALSSLPDWINWLKWLSMFRYGVEALATNEFSGHYCYGYNNSASLTFKCSNSLPSQLAGNPCVCVWSPESSDICCNGTRFLEFRGFETSTDWIWWDMLALSGIIAFFMVLAYVALRLIKKEK